MTIHSLPLLHKAERYVGLAGDWHGNWRWAVACIDALGKEGIKSVFSVGDFGIWASPSGEEYLGKLQKVLEKHAMTAYVTLGNHENYDLIDSYEKDDQGIAWFRHNIAVLPRVYGFRHRHRSFLSLGGAPSIDFRYRTIGKDWWPQEMITDADVDLAIATAEELGGVDVMLTHDAPDQGTRAVQHIIDTNPMGWSRAETNYAAEGRVRMTRATYTIQPGLQVHGHYHVADYGRLHYGSEDETGLILSLNCDGVPGNLAIVDVDDISNIKISRARHGFNFEEVGSK